MKKARTDLVAEVRSMGLLQLYRFELDNTPFKAGDNSGAFCNIRVSVLMPDGTTSVQAGKRTLFKTDHIEAIKQYLSELKPDDPIHSRWLSFELFKDYSKNSAKLSRCAIAMKEGLSVDDCVVYANEQAYRERERPDREYREMQDYYGEDARDEMRALGVEVYD